MKFRNVKLVLFRTKLIKSNFYEDITFLDKKVCKQARKAIEHWIFNLEQNNKVKKFRDLFVELPEVVFPIRITSAVYSRFSSFDLEIIDYENKNYYMIRRDYYSKDATSYIIGRRNSQLEPLIDRDFHYKICGDKTILLVETGAMPLNPDGTNGQFSIDFCYDFQEHTTKATLNSFSSRNKIELQYPAIGDDFNKKVSDFLLHMNDNNYYYYDVFPILKFMLLDIFDENVSLSIIAEVEKEICSEIYIIDGIVQKYTKTEIISEEEIRISKIIFAKKLKEFLAEKS